MYVPLEFMRDENLKAPTEEEKKIIDIMGGQEDKHAFNFQGDGNEYSDDQYMKSKNYNISGLSKQEKRVND